MKVEELAGKKRNNEKQNGEGNEIEKKVQQGRKNRREYGKQ